MKKNTPNLVLNRNIGTYNDRCYTFLFSVIMPTMKEANARMENSLGYRLIGLPKGESRSRMHCIYRGSYSRFKFL